MQCWKGVSGGIVSVHDYETMKELADEVGDSIRSLAVCLWQRDLGTKKRVMERSLDQALKVLHRCLAEVERIKKELDDGG
jgi:hypothetical protein